MAGLLAISLWACGTLEATSWRNDYSGKSYRYYSFQLHQINGNRVEVPNNYKSTYATLYRNCFTYAEGKF